MKAMKQVCEETKQRVGDEHRVRCLETAGLRERITTAIDMIQSGLVERETEVTLRTTLADQ